MGTRQGTRKYHVGAEKTRCSREDTNRLYRPVVEQIKTTKNAEQEKLHPAYNQSCRIQY